MGSGRSNFSGQELELIFWKKQKHYIRMAFDLEVYGEYEVFWDGVLIGKNGNPGQEAVLPPEGKLWTDIQYSD